MPVAPTYPGVYVEELPSGVHTITGVSTAVTAFLGYFLQGPMNTATQIFSVADLERTFGVLDTRSEAGYSIRQFFANGGAEAWVVRVAAADAGVTAPSLAVVPIIVGAGITLTASAANEGTWGNWLRLTVDYGTADSTGFNLTVTLVDANSPPNTVATEVYRNLTLVATAPNYAVDVVNNASGLIQLALSGTAAATDRPVATGTVGGDISGLNLGSATPTLLTNVADTMTVTFGATAATAFTLATQPSSLAALATALQTKLQSLTVNGLALIPGATVSVVPGTGTARFLQIAAATASTTVADTLTFVGGLATLLGLAAEVGPPATPSTNVQQYALGVVPAAAVATQGTVTKGGDGSPPDGSGLIGDQTAPKSGLFALDAVDDFNILCLPDVMNLSDTEASAVITAAGNYCAPRWAFYIVDVPQPVGGPNRDDMNVMEAWLDAYATLRNTYSAVYYPRPQIPDPVNGYRLRTVASSGTIAGLYAQTDGARGVWKAPAGTAATLTGVVSLAYKLTDAENGALNPLAINCLRTFPVYGNVCWGARTLVGADQLASDWKYIPVRRTAFYIEDSLYRGTQWVVFEPNDEPLWSQIRLNVGAFMRSMFQQGAFQGSTPASAYFVKCDSETTTQADINLGVVNIVVGFAPLKPAEFVILQIQQIAGQIPT